MKINWIKTLPVIITVAGTISAAVFTPSFIAAHPAAFAVVNAVAMVLHAALPSVFETPRNVTRE